ncbi:MAG: hypothetical protein ACO1RX_08070 [Candidatus Sericytochromatia bacterium]
MSSRTLLITFLTTACLSACGTPTVSPVSGRSVDPNFKLADAIRIYSCAVDKETDAAKKEKLQTGLNIHKYFSNNEAGWTADINKDRNMQYRILSEVAVSYECF